MSADRFPAGHAIGNILSGYDNPRTGQPVWRNSYYENTFEHRMWRPFAGGKRRGAKRRIGALLKSVRATELRTRRERQASHRGTRNGFLGPVAIAVLESLYNDFLDYATGRLDPAIATIAAKVGHSYSAVHRALVVLRNKGFIQWIRRSRPLDCKGEARPQVEQITSAYVLLIPPEFDRLIAHKLGEGPIPADEHWRRDERKREWEAMLAGMSASAFHRDHWQGDRLAGEALARIARMLDERESSSAGETRGV